MRQRQQRDKPQLFRVRKTKPNTSTEHALVLLLHISVIKRGGWLGDRVGSVTNILAMLPKADITLEAWALFRIDVMSCRQSSAVLLKWLVK